MSEGIILKKQKAVFMDLGIQEFDKTLEIQNILLNRKIIEKSEPVSDNSLPAEPDYILFVEHPLVFTLGKNGGKDDFYTEHKFIYEQNIKVIDIDRGGRTTCHAPGQAVVYPIVDIKRLKTGPKAFVYLLEEIMQSIASDLGVEAKRDKRNHGIWIKGSKLGSIGLSIKKGITMHGFAINIYNDLEPFSWIKPCGLSNIELTSIHQELKIKEKKCLLSEKTLNYPNMETVKNLVIKYFSQVLGYTIKQKKCDFLE